MKTHGRHLGKAFVAYGAAALLAACTLPCAAQSAEWRPDPPNPKAPYPAESRMNGEQGTVLLRVRTTPEGRPSIVEVRQSSGYARLDLSAMETVRKWRFSPTPDDGTIVWREVPIRFFITSQPQPPSLD